MAWVVADIGTILAIAAIVGIFLAGAAGTFGEQLLERRRERGERGGKLPWILGLPAMALGLVLFGVLGLVALVVAIAWGQFLLTTKTGAVLIVLAVVVAVAYGVGRSVGREEGKDD